MGILDATTTGKAKFNPTGGLKRILESTGRMPPVELIITPIEQNRPSFRLNRFLTYEFNTSILTPVDSFSFSMSAPDQEEPPTKTIRSGDIVRLFGNDNPLGVGIIDVVNMQTTFSEGESLSLTGRDLMSQLEDNDVITLDSNPVFANKFTPSQVIKELAKGTRIQSSKAIFQDAPKKGYLFATEPTETKLNALQRYLEPLNCLSWMNNQGNIVIGRPNMSQASKGKLVLNKEKRIANVLSMSVSYQTTKVPNIIVPIYAGQELVQSQVGQQSALYNSKSEPTRLRKNGHIVQKTTVVSNPQGTDPQELSEINRLQAGGQNLLQAYAKRDMARANVNERVVQVKMAGHYNDRGEPFLPDTVYNIEYDRGDIDEKMYLFECSYQLSEEEGQVTYLTFCPLNSIVSDIRAI